jgi:hypothetical protein
MNVVVSMCESLMNLLHLTKYKSNRVIMIFNLCYFCVNDKQIKRIDKLLVLNATYSNISAISWRPVLVMEEAGVSGENHRPWASNWLTLSLATASRLHLFVIYKAGREPTYYW